MKRYGLWGPSLREFLTFEGRVIVHSDRAEMEWLFPGAPVREVPASIPPDWCLPVEFHPDMASVRWPLTKQQFR